MNYFKVDKREILKRTSRGLHWENKQSMLKRSIWYENFKQKGVGYMLVCLQYFKMKNMKKNCQSWQEILKVGQIFANFQVNLQTCLNLFFKVCSIIYI